MRKLSLLIKLFIISILLASCYRSPSIHRDNKKDVIESKKDSIVSIIKNNDTTEFILNNSGEIIPKKEKSSTKKRIVHGSDNQIELDSIKREKAKLKKPD